MVQRELWKIEKEKKKRLTKNHLTGKRNEKN